MDRRKIGISAPVPVPETVDAVQKIPSVRPISTFHDTRSYKERVAASQGGTLKPRIPAPLPPSTENPPVAPRRPSLHTRSRSNPGPIQLNSAPTRAKSPLDSAFHLHQPPVPQQRQRAATTIAQLQPPISQQAFPPQPTRPAPLRQPNPQQATPMFLAMYDFKGSSPKHLSFAKSEQLVSVGESDRSQANWFNAKSVQTGQVGWVPRNYVSPLQPSSPPLQTTQSNHPPQTSTLSTQLLPQRTQSVPLPQPDGLTTKSNAGCNAQQQQQPSPPPPSTQVPLLPPPQHQQQQQQHQHQHHQPPQVLQSQHSQLHTQQHTQQPQSTIQPQPLPRTRTLLCEYDVYDWYHGPCSRNEAEYHLQHKPDQTFLVRDSQSCPGDYSLSVRFQGQSFHYKLLKSPLGGVQLQQGSETYTDLAHLVEHHKQTQGELVCVLVATFPKASRQVIYGHDDTTDAQWEIERSSLDLVKKLGSGQYGEVHLGHLQRDGNVIKVAVKTFKRATSDIQEFTKEADIMKRMRHPGLVNLLGCITNSEPMLIVTEFMPKGDLLLYLRGEGKHEFNNNSVAMLYVATQVADAMAYLESNNFIHRDLAARNCLVGEELLVKVADFGLSRLLADGDGEVIYTAQEGSKFPIKWTAPEALQFNTFTVKSDVWAYGVLLWEVTTLGMNPYPGVALEDVLSKLHAHYRMPKPDQCADAVYNVMQACWRWNPDERPTFQQIKDDLENLNSTPVTQSNTNYNQQHHQQQQQQQQQLHPQHHQQHHQQQQQHIQQLPMQMHPAYSTNSVHQQQQYNGQHHQQQQHPQQQPMHMHHQQQQLHQEHQQQQQQHHHQQQQFQTQQSQFSTNQSHQPQMHPHLRQQQAPPIPPHNHHQQQQQQQHHHQHQQQQQQQHHQHHQQQPQFQHQYSHPPNNPPRPNRNSTVSRTPSITSRQQQHHSQQQQPQQQHHQQQQQQQQVKTSPRDRGCFDFIMAKYRSIVQVQHELQQLAPDDTKACELLSKMAKDGKNIHELATKHTTFTWAGLGDLVFLCDEAIQLSKQRDLDMQIRKAGAIVGVCLELVKLMGNHNTANA